MKFINATFLLSLFTIQAFAGEIRSAKIETLMVDRAHGAKVFIKLDKTHPTPINCHANNWQFVLDISDDLGKTLYSNLLTSYAAGKTIHLKGTSSCSLYPNIETLRRIELN